MLSHVSKGGPRPLDIDVKQYEWSWLAIGNTQGIVKSHKDT